MTDKLSVVHHTFRLEREYDATCARVFAAFADIDAKARWFRGGERWLIHRRELDFRVGGREVLSGGLEDGPAHTFVAHYFDIVPSRRIIYGYDMFVGERKLSVSLATIELEARGRRTQLSITEQGAFLDGHQAGSEREAGTVQLLEKLAASFVA
jgi:uncharacterized protein YndB with AHSA1/START domain